MKLLAQSLHPNDVLHMFPHHLIEYYFYKRDFSLKNNHKWKFIC